MKTFLTPLLLLLLLASQASAGILNGDFSVAGTSQDPFAYWTTLSNFDRPSDGGEFAQFDSTEQTDPMLIRSIHLAQSFSLDSGSLKLSFELKFSSIGTFLDGSVRDSFQVTLLHGNSPLFPSNPSDPDNFPAFYSLDNNGESLDANFVTSWGIGNGFKRITLDVSSRSPQTLVLDFLLNGNGDGLDTSVQLDNVAISNVGVVPEPASFLIWAASLGIACVWQRRRSSRNTSSKSL